MTEKPKLVLLHPNDNVLISCQSIGADEMINFDAKQYNISADIDVGHKIAKQALIKGEKVIRYGVPIGSMTADAKQGEHVHIHNMKSDYMPSYTRQAKVGE